MRNIKKLIAGILVATTMMTSSLVTFAGVPSPTYVKMENLPKQDNNTKDHKDCTVISEMNETGATVILVKADKYAKNVSVDLGYANNPDTDEKVSITEIGKAENEDGIFNIKAGNKVRKVRLTTDADLLTINANAFKSSRVKSIVIKCKQVSFKKDAFNRTRQKKIKLYFTTANQIFAEEGAFNGLEKITLVCKDENESEKAKEYLSKYFDGEIVISEMPKR